METAMMALSLSEFPEMLTCPVCLDRYDDQERLPKLLNCHHTVCLACLKVMFRETRHQRFSHSAPSEMRCPLCRTVNAITSCVDRMPTNFYIQKFSRCAMKKAQCQVQDGDVDFEYPQCVSHTLNNVSIAATMWCEQCEKSLCVNCVVEHVAADHSLILVREKARRVREEIKVLLRETSEMKSNSAKTREALRHDLARFIRLTDTVTDSIIKQEERDQNLEGMIVIPEEKLRVDRSRPCDIKSLFDYAQRMRDAKRTIQQFAENRPLIDIHRKLREVMNVLHRVQMEMDDKMVSR